MAALGRTGLAKGALRWAVLSLGRRPHLQRGEPPVGIRLNHIEAHSGFAALAGASRGLVAWMLYIVLF